MAEQSHPAVSQPITTDSKGYPSAPPTSYPPAPLSHSSYNHVPYQGYPEVYPPVSQPNNAMAPPAGYPPVSAPASQTNYAPPPAPAAAGVAAVPAPTPQPNYNAIPNPIPVLGPQYCLPHLVDLGVTRKLMTVTDDFVITDVNNNLLFKIKGIFFTMHSKRVLLDSTGKPIITLRHKFFTAHSRWMACKGDSKDSKDVLFNAKTTSVIQFKTKLNMYLAKNKTSEDYCDFKVEGSWSERSCVVYVGESNTIAARMHMQDSAQSFFLGKDRFMITVYPNVDYAFIVALIVILDAINARNDIVV